MKGKVNCTCGWSWNKSDSSAKDMYICHECGRDNSNNMKNGGWLDKHDVAQEGETLPSVRDLINDTMNRKIQAHKGKGKETNVTKKDNVKTTKPKVDTTKPLTKEQVEARRLLKGLKQNIAADEEIALQKRKDEGFKNMQEFYKSPLGSPGYFTPEGAIIGALQAGIHSGVDLSEGDYKGAAINAGLAALPFVPKILKTAGSAFSKAAPVEEGIFSTYVTPKEAAVARAERMLSQESKWDVNSNSYTKDKFTNINDNFEEVFANEIGKNPQVLGTNAMGKAFVFKDNGLSPANQSRVAAHEVGHFYRNMADEANEWNSFFDFSKLKHRTNVYLRGKPTAVGSSVNESKPGILNLQKQGVPHGDEIRERAAQLKDYIAQKNGIPLNKDFTVTQAQLDDAIENYVKDTNLDNSMSSMLNSLKDKKGFLNAMNKYALGAVPLTVGVGQLEKQKNGGWLDNYNDSQASAPEGMVGDGFSNVGRNYSPAWGGQFQTGGKLTFLQPTSDKLPEGYRIPYDTPSTERAGSIGGENGEPAYLVPEFKYGHPIYDPIEEFKRTGEHLGGPFKTWQEAEEWEETVRHPAVENRETIMFPQEKFAMGGSIPGSVGFTYARTKGIPSEGPYAKKTMPSAQNGADMYGNPILADLKYDQSVNRTNYNPRTNQMIFGHDMPLFISQEQRDKTLAHENRHAWQFANDRTNFNMVHNPEHAFQDRLQKRPEMMSTDEVFEKYHNRKQKETEMDVKAFKGNNPQFSFMPNEMVYKKFVDHMQYNNPNSVEGEAQYYENTGKKSFKNGGWLDGYDVAQNGKKKFKLKDERLQGIRPSESTFVKKPNFDAQQSKVQKTYVDQVGKQMAEEKRRAKLTKDQREREDYNARNEERGSFQAHVPESNWDRSKAIVSNPLTAFGYVARNESLPARFQHGERNNLDYALDWVNPLQGAASASNIPGQLGRGEFLDAGLSALDAIDLGVYAKGAMKASKPFFQKAGQQLGNISTSIAPELRQGLRTAGPLFGKKVSEHVMGLGQGIEDIVKGRPIFETFPITSAQKQASNIAQDRALQEGVDFAENWFYKNGQIRQSVRNKIDDISVSEPNAKMNDYRYNPFLSTQNKLVSSRSGDLPFENISDEAKEYIQNRRGQIGGVNMGDTQESITLRNMGMYRLPPQQIKNTVVHESAHTAQDIGDYVPWGTMTTEFSPNLKYFTSNPNTNIGQRFKNALRTPRKPSGDTYAHRTWQSSPNELHSELMSARSQLYDKFLKEGKSAEEAIDLLQNPGDETLDALNKIGGLDQFFKQDIWGKSKVPTQTKRDLMRILPAAVPVAVGAGALQQQKEGGVIKDDRGQWDHPGEITEIGSNEITMEGVPYDVLGVSDTGDTKLMKPGKNYKFKGKKVTEFPMAKNGLRQEQKGLQNLDNLTNFTNYNKPQPGSWLEKYN